MTGLTRIPPSAPLHPLLEESVLDLPDGILDLLPIGICVCDEASSVVRYNRAATEIWGFSPRLGEPVERAFGLHRLYRRDGTPLSPAERPSARARAAGHPVRNEEIMLARPDGSRRLITVDADPLHDEAGDLVGVLVCLRDVPEAGPEFSPPREPHDRPLPARLPAGADDGSGGEDRPADDAVRYREIFDAVGMAIWEQDFSDVAALLDEIRAEGVTDLRAHLAARPDRVAEALRRVRPTDANRFAVELFQADRKEALLHSLGVVFLPETMPAFAEELCAIWEGRRRFEGEAPVQTLKGRRLDVAFTIAFNGQRLERTIVSVLDISAQKVTERAAQHFAAIVESSDDAILSKDLNGIITSWNKGAERLFGYEAEEVVGQPVTVLIPLERHNEEPTILSRIRRGDRIDHYETVRERKDGSRVDISLTVSPIKNRAGEIIGASKIARDITERRRAEERQNLLLGEMDHRVKNLFALASSIVALSARSAKTPEELASDVRDRLGALARAHALTLAKRPVQHGFDDAAGQAPVATSLHSLVKTIMTPYDDRQGRISVDGPDVPLAGGSVTSFALLLHEFATNAAKYGALASADGLVSVESAYRDELVVVTWAETGGPKVPPPFDSEGFGSRLARATVTRQLGGEISRDWTDEGLRIRLSVPRRSLVE